MQLVNEFEVGVPTSQAWLLLSDVERIAPCLPGAALAGKSADGEFEGTVKVKVGPIGVEYRGKAVFLDQRQEEGVLVLRAEGRETRGQGKASATITATLSAVGDARTRVSVVTDLTITGKVAQFGRGVLADVSGNLLSQFAGNLDRMLSASSPVRPPTASGAEPESAPAPSGTLAAPEGPALSLVRVAAVPIAKRALPVLVVLAVVALVLWRLA